MEPGTKPLAMVALLTTVFVIVTGMSAQRGQEPLTVVEEVFEATVIRVDDGDSVIVNDARGPLTLHLDGVDAPELSQEFGPESKAFLSKLAVGRLVTIRLKSRAPAGEESVARVQLKGSDLSAALIQKGLAWHCRRYTGGHELQRAETQARAEKRGLWSMSNPTPPWHHRGTANCRQEAHDG